MKFEEKLKDKYLYKKGLNIFKLFYFFSQFIKSKTKKRVPSSRWGVDLILNDIFKNKKKGFYIDIGCHHPLINNHTFLFYRKGWSGINIDLDFNSIDMFNFFRPKDFNVQAALSNDILNTEIYFYHNRAAKNTISKQFGLDAPEVKKIKTNILNNLIYELKLQNQKIDFINIDVEGNAASSSKSRVRRDPCATLKLQEFPCLRASDMFALAKAQQPSSLARRVVLFRAGGAMDQNFYLDRKLKVFGVWRVVVREIADVVGMEYNSIPRRARATKPEGRFFVGHWKRRCYDAVVFKVKESYLGPWAGNVLVVASAVRAGRALTPYIVLLSTDHLVKIVGRSDAVKVVLEAVLRAHVVENVGHAGLRVSGVRAGDVSGAVDEAVHPAVARFEASAKGCLAAERIVVSIALQDSVSELVGHVVAVRCQTAARNNLAKASDATSRFPHKESFEVSDDRLGGWNLLALWTDHAEKFFRAWCASLDTGVVNGFLPLLVVGVLVDDVIDVGAVVCKSEHLEESRNGKHVTGVVNEQVPIATEEGAELCKKEVIVFLLLQDKAGVRSYWTGCIDHFTGSRIALCDAVDDMLREDSRCHVGVQEVCRSVRADTDTFDVNVPRVRIPLSVKALRRNNNFFGRYLWVD